MGQRAINQPERPGGALPAFSSFSLWYVVLTDLINKGIVLLDTTARILNFLSQNMKQ